MATKSQALVPAKDAKDGKVSIHLRRLIQQTMGATPEAIAKAEGVSFESIKRSIVQAEVYRERNSLEFANLAVGHIAVSLSEDVSNSLRSALKAKKTIKKFVRRNGSLHEQSVTVVDHETQLSAVSEYRGLVQAIQPKGGNINVNAAANAEAKASSFSEASYQPGVEEMIDKIRSKVEEQNSRPRELATIKDDEADIIEGEPDSVSTDEEESLDEEGGSDEPVETSP